MKKILKISASIDSFYTNNNNNECNVYLETIECPILDETDEYYIILLEYDDSEIYEEKVYKKLNKYSYCLNEICYPEYSDKCVSGEVYVLEGEELKGKQILSNKFKEKLNEIAIRVNKMKNIIEKEF